MKLLLAIFNLLLSVIIIINFIFIMKDFIKNWALINSNSCNYGPLSFIAFLIFFLVIYQSKFWGLFSVLYLHIY